MVLNLIGLTLRWGIWMKAYSWEHLQISRSSNQIPNSSLVNSIRSYKCASENIFTFLSSKIRLKGFNEWFSFRLWIFFFWKSSNWYMHQEFISGTSLAVQWLRLYISASEGASLIPGWGTKILHAVQPCTMLCMLCSQKRKGNL